MSFYSTLSRQKTHAPYQIRTGGLGMSTASRDSHMHDMLGYETHVITDYTNEALQTRGLLW